MGHPVRYVRNIYKYYVAYKLIEETDAAKKAAICAATTQPAPAGTSTPPQPRDPANPVAPVRVVGADPDQDSAKGGGYALFRQDTSLHARPDRPASDYALEIYLPLEMLTKVRPHRQ
jgi:hypothetical protein